MSPAVCLFLLCIRSVYSEVLLCDLSPDSDFTVLSPLLLLLLLLCVFSLLLSLPLPLSCPLLSLFPGSDRSQEPHGVTPALSCFFSVCVLSLPFTSINPVSLQFTAFVSQLNVSSKCHILSLSSESWLKKLAFTLLLLYKCTSRLHNCNYLLWNHLAYPPKYCENDLNQLQSTAFTRLGVIFLKLIINGVNAFQPKHTFLPDLYLFF